MPKPPRQRGHFRWVALVPALLLLTACTGAGTPAEKPEALRAEFTAVAEALERAGALFIGGSQVAALQAQVTSARQGTQDELDARGRLALELLRLGETEESLMELRHLQKLEEQNRRDQSGHLLRQRRILDKLLVASLRLGEDMNCVARHGSEACIMPVGGDGVHQDLQGAEAAMEYARAILAREPKDLKALWFLNLAAQLAGVYPAEVEEEFLIPPERFTVTDPVPRFRNVAPAMGLDTFDLAGGSIVEDLDNDGWLDILTSTMDPWGSLTLLRNQGDGTFINNTVAAGLDVQWGGLSLSAADYDNDGDVDVLVLRGGWLQAQGLVRNSLLRNNGDGTFSDVTRAAGLAEPARPTQAAAWADYDLDGDLDLFIGNEGIQQGDRKEVFADNLFRNNGDGTFTDVAVMAGVTNDRYAKSVVWGDYDSDGDPDLYISNIGPNRLYRNNGDGTFTDVAEDLGVTEPEGRSFASWFFDYDQDGDLDLFSGAYTGQLEDVAADIMGQRPERPEQWPRLYRNDHGRFTDVTRLAGLDHPSLPMGANFGDFDGDGYPDIYLGTGTPAYEAIMPNILYHNNGDGTFTDVTFAAGVGHLQKGHGISFGDLDRDGDMDIHLQAGGFFPGDRFGNVLFVNPMAPAHFVVVKLSGRRSPRSGIGARIHLRVRREQGDASIYRWVSSGGTFGISPGEQLFGLGIDAREVLSVSVRWPAGGPEQVLTDIPMDRWVQVTEGEEQLEVRRFTPVTLGRQEAGWGPTSLPASSPSP